MKASSKGLGIELSNHEKIKLIHYLEIAGFKKHAKKVATKMMKSGKGMNNYSKITGKLKKGH